MTSAEVSSIAANYRHMAYDLEAHAAKLRPTMPLTRGTIQHWARICKVAALVEEIDPDWLPAACNVCGGKEACDWKAHLLRTTFISRTDR